MNSKIGINADAIKIDGDIGVFKQELYKFSTIGFDVVEVPIHGVEAVRGGSLQKERLNEVKALLKDFEFQYTVHAPDLLNLSRRSFLDVHKSTFISSIHFTKEIGAKGLVYHYGSSGRFLKGQKGHPEVEKENLVEVSDIADAAGVLIYVENMPMTDLGELAEFIQGVNHPKVKMCLDIGHAFIKSSGSASKLIEAIKSARAFIGHIHIHDNFGRRANGADDKEGYLLSLTTPYLHKVALGIGDLHLPLGWGDLPYRDVFHALGDYEGVWLFELNPRFENAYKDILDMLRENLKGSLHR